MSHAHAFTCSTKSDKVKFYQQALAINATVWILQLITIVFFANSLTLLGDWSHGFADIIILFATYHIFASELQNPEKDYSRRKKWLVAFAIVVLWGMAVYIFYEAIWRILYPVDFLGWPIAILALLSTAGNFLAHQRISSVSACEHDNAHLVNVAHLITDAAISFCVFISAMGKILFNLPAIDTWMGIGVGIWMIYLGWKIVTGKAKH